MVSSLPGEFDPDREEWSSYAERIEFYLVAQGITDADKQRAVLLSACGPTMFGLLKRIVTPGSLRDYSFERLVELAREHLNPKPSIAVLRAKFTRGGGIRIGGGTVRLVRFSGSNKNHQSFVRCYRLSCRRPLSRVASDTQTTP